MDWKRYFKEARENSTYGLAKAKAMRAKRVVSKATELTDDELKAFEEKQLEMRKRLKDAGVELGSFPPWNRVIF